MSIQRQIFENIKAKLEELPWPNLVEYENIRLMVADFNSHEFPAVQIYDNGETATNLQALNEVVLNFSVEIVLTRTPGELVNQGLLFDRKLEVKRKIGEDPTLGIVGSPSIGSFKNVQYVGGVTDFHTLNPHYLARLDFQALFNEPFVRDC
jgi:hypothetical protein